MCLKLTVVSGWETQLEQVVPGPRGALDAAPVFQLEEVQ